MCIFWYGVVSSYSGMNIFEQWLFQLYNIVFTAFPIMWFAVFDYEYSKEVLRRDPKYYIYVKNPTFTNYKFGKWIFYSIWQSFVLCILAFLPFESQGGTFWMEGNFVFIGVVCIVNIKTLIDTSNHTFVSLFFSIGSIVSFFAASAAASYLAFTKLYGTLGPTVYSVEFYYILILILLAIVQVDIGVNYVNREVRKRLIRVVKTLRKSISSHAHKKVHTSKSKRKKHEGKAYHTGFAFSQESGNAPHVVNKLIKKNLAKRKTMVAKDFSALVESTKLDRKSTTYKGKNKPEKNSDKKKKSKRASMSVVKEEDHE
mmetsp:Transcript_11345/g.12855  ORF Transcript_11345/g.12855 Transcript_11345/m.12855 type:complete len:314 (-) Transcript_11345:11-952(-)